MTTATNLVLMLEGPEGGPDDSWAQLIERIEALGYQTLQVETIFEAEQVIEHASPPVYCALLPVEFADRRLKQALKGLRKRARKGGLHLAAVGPAPDRNQRRYLRSAGVIDSLWEPFSDETLRFQLNRLTCPDEPNHVREAERVPTDLMAGAAVAGREREAFVYSLSESGAYLHTNRACMDGASITVSLPLPTGPITIPAIVVFTNVIGNLRRDNLPLGMGVSFPELPQAESRALRTYVEERRAQLTV